MFEDCGFVVFCFWAVNCADVFSLLFGVVCWLFWFSLCLFGFVVCFLLVVLRGFIVWNLACFFNSVASYYFSLYF